MLKLTMSAIPHDTETAVPRNDRLVGCLFIDVSGIRVVKLNTALLAVYDRHAEPRRQSLEGWEQRSVMSPEEHVIDLRRRYRSGPVRGLIELGLATECQGSEPALRRRVPVRVRGGNGNPLALAGAL